MPYNIATTAQ